MATSSARNSWTVARTCRRGFSRRTPSSWLLHSSYRWPPMASNGATAFDSYSYQPDHLIVERGTMPKPCPASLLSYFQLPFHPFVTMARQGPKTLIAVDGKGAGLSRSEFDDNGLAGADILLNGQTPRRILDDEVVGDNRGHTRQCQLDRLSPFDDQVVRLIRVAIENDGSTLDTIGGHRHDEWRTRMREVLRPKPRRQVRATVQEFLALDVAT